MKIINMGPLVVEVSDDFDEEAMETKFQELAGSQITVDQLAEKVKQAFARTRQDAHHDEA